MQPIISDVIPGWCVAPDPESRDSGFDASHRPGMTVLEASFAGCIFSRTLRMRSARPSWALMQRRRIQLVLDALEMIKPLNRMVELGAFLFRKLGLHAGDGVGELGAVQFLQRRGDI